MRKSKHMQRFGLAASLVLVAGGFIVLPLLGQKRYISQNCPGYTPYHGFSEAADLVECGGIIGVEKFRGDDVYTIRNPSEKNGWDFFEVYNYTLAEGQLFYVDAPDLAHSALYYAAASEVDESWKFRKIDVETAELSFYQSLEDVPDVERQHFAKLLFR